MDNAASTAIHSEVLEEMIPFLKEQYGNPSSIHKFGRLSHKGIEKARKQVAELINAKPNEIILTSGGTESNNTALFGIANLKKGNHIITSSIEHEAILEPCKKLEKEGFDITYLSVNDKGQINLDELRKKLEPIMLRRTRKQVIKDLPQRTNKILRIPPTEEQLELQKGHRQIIQTVIQKRYLKVLVVVE